MEEVEKRGEVARVGAKRRKGEMREESLLFIGWPLPSWTTKTDQTSLAHSLDQPACKARSHVWVQGH